MIKVINISIFAAKLNQLFIIMNKLFLSGLFFLLVFMTQSFGQKMTDAIQFAYEDLIWDVPGDPILQKAFEIPDGYLIFRKHVIRGPGGFNYFIEKLDKNLKRTKFVDISADIDERNYFVEEIVKFADKYFIVTSKQLRDISTEEYYIQEVDRETGTVGKRELIFRYKYDSRRSYMRMAVNISPNDNFMLFTFSHRGKVQTYTRRRRDVDTQTFIVFNSRMEEVEREEDVKMRIGQNSFSIDQVLISDEGVIYLLGVKIVEERNDEQFTSILKFDKGDLMANRINFSAGTLTDLSLKFNKEGNLYGGGYYYEDEGRGSGYGVVVMAVNPDTGEPISVSNQLIDKDILIEGLSDREKARIERRESYGKETKQVHDLDVRQIVTHKDGSASLIGENWDIVISSTVDANGNRTTTVTYTYNELFVTRISSEGEIISTVKMPKKYSGKADLQKSFHAMDMDNDLGIIFYDNRQNLIEIGPKGVLPYTRKSKKTALSLVRVSPDGKQTREGIIDYAMKPYSSYRHYRFNIDMEVIDEDKMLFVTYYGKKKFGYALATPK